MRSETPHVLRLAALLTIIAVTGTSAVTYDVAAEQPGVLDVTLGTIAELLTTQPASNGAVFVVQGYRQPNDDGGGVFRYDQGSTATVDGGTIFQPQTVPGRFLRQYDAQGDVYAEWFGAFGDGDGATPHADQNAINACLKVFARVRLLAKTYGVRPCSNDPYHAVDLGPNYHIIGSGRTQTEIKLLDNTNPGLDQHFRLLSNRLTHESAESVVISDLALDCNFDAQDKHATIHAIQIRGGGALVERVNFRGYGTAHMEECFVVFQTLVFKDASSSRRAATYRDLDFTGCGHNGMLNNNVAEITHMSLGGANNFGNVYWILPVGYDPNWDSANGGENDNNWWPSTGGLVENCVIHDEIFNPATQKSTLNGITYHDCIGMTVRSNRVSNFEGQGVYVMSWWNRDTRIQDNRFLNVKAGVALQIHDAGGGVPMTPPRHENVLIERNTIHLGSPLYDPWGTQGVQLYGANLAGIRFDDIKVRHNSIMGRAYTNAAGTRVCPVGIVVQILNANARQVLFEHNRIELPDYAPAVYVPQEPYSEAMSFFPMARWASDYSTQNVVYRGNRNSLGRLLNPFLINWYANNAPQYGASLPDHPWTVGTNQTLLASYTSNWDTATNLMGKAYQGAEDYGTVGAAGSWFYGYTTNAPANYKCANFIQFLFWDATNQYLSFSTPRGNGGYCEMGREKGFAGAVGRGVVRRWTSGISGAVKIEGTAYLTHKYASNGNPSYDGSTLRIFVGDDMLASLPVTNPVNGSATVNYTAPVTFCVTGFVNAGTAVDVMMDRNANADQGDYWEIFPHTITVLHSHFAKASLDWAAAALDGIPEQGQADTAGLGNWTFGSITNTMPGTNTAPGPSVTNFIPYPYYRTNDLKWCATTNRNDYFYDLGVQKRAQYPAGNASLGHVPYRWSIRRWQNSGHPAMRVTINGEPLIKIYGTGANYDGANAHVYVDGKKIWTSFVAQNNSLGSRTVDGVTFTAAGGATNYLTNVLVKSSGVIDFAVDGHAITTNETTYWEPVIVFEKWEPVKSTMLMIK